MPHSRLPEINGNALKVAREKRGMERSELASQCCLSSKMIAQLEEGGTSYFYSFQLKVSAAKRVGSYLGLSTSDYLQEFADAIETKDVSSVDQKALLEVDEIQAPVTASKSVVDEGEQLDDLIYESMNSGTSLPHVGAKTTRAKWISNALFVFLGATAVYGLESWLHISDQVINLVGKSGNEKLNFPEPPKELATQDQQQITEGDPSVKTEAKLEPAMVTVPAQNQCGSMRDDQVPIYKSPNPSKLGDAVNVKTFVKQTLCVTDGQGKQVVVDLEPNTAHSFKGAPPFIVMAQDLDNVEMYYQGWRVRPPSTGMRQLKLVEIAMQ